MNYESNLNSSQREQEHRIKMVNRRSLEISGVKEVDSFDNEEFLMQTSMGYLVIRGENLHMKNLDVEQGIVSIKGRIYEISYIDDHQGEKAKGFFSKLFK
ncbi:sporulation protein YabP [Salirhabdus salicampi]|uniref:sporulation protein YabP n=1 Tax=Salirhabdus salicampi TaxID=476102 RepID=UPI0020C52065|nr:sporulation protein YabP [Salirhabdus salicampi]MCP8618181.1 sporulation protein YabP [Salirhabdus salicampi]